MNERLEIWLPLVRDQQLGAKAEGPVGLFNIH